MKKITCILIALLIMGCSSDDDSSNNTNDFQRVLGSWLLDFRTIDNVEEILFSPETIVFSEDANTDDQSGTATYNDGINLLNLEFTVNSATNSIVFTNENDVDTIYSYSFQGDDLRFTYVTLEGDVVEIWQAN